VVAAAAVAILLLLLFIVLRNLLHVCRPNEVLIFAGRQHKLPDGSTVGFRVIFGGRALRTPLLERVDSMALTTIPIEVSVSDAYTSGGIPLSVRATANVKLSSDPTEIVHAIERFLGRARAEVGLVARETLEGALRGALATLDPEEVDARRLFVAKSIADEVREDYGKLGLTLDTFKIQHVDARTR
jgi:flotillin